MSANIGGTANVTNLQGLRDWYLNSRYEDVNKLTSSAFLSDVISRNFGDTISQKDQQEIKDTILSAIANSKLYGIHKTIIGSDAMSIKESKEKIWHEQVAERAKCFDRFFMNMLDFHQTLKVYFWCDDLTLVYFGGNPRNGMVIQSPNQYLQFVPEEDYSSYTPNQLLLKFGYNSDEAQKASALSVTNQITVSKLDVENAKQEATSNVERLKQEIQDVEDAKEGELAEIKAKIEQMQAELRAKQDSLLRQLNDKKAEMERIKKQLEGQIYYLDCQIYAIRCYAGEIVQFAHIRQGKNAPDTEPIVIHQKLRFLDEELGRLTSLYSIEWDDIGMFETFLQHHPLALEYFAPNERCVTLVRISRTGKIYAKTKDDPWSNIITDYEYNHGKTIGIIIRNGENLYLGWTDEDRIHIDDDLVISKSQAPVIEINPYKEKTSSELKKEEEERNRIMDGLISRTFVYNILQGFVDNTAFLPLPKGVSLKKPSKYVVFSVADRWLKDNTYGSFNEIIEKANSKLLQGDFILTTQHLTAIQSNYSFSRETYGMRPWENSRGRGERNRTRDCSVQDCAIMPINLIEFDKPIKMIQFQIEAEKKSPNQNYVHEIDADTFFRHVKGAVVEGNKYIVSKWNKETQAYDFIADHKWYSDALSYLIVKEYDRVDKHVYVSVEKADTWNPRTCEKSYAHSNFELFPEEFINLTYFNSVWLKWVINTKELGGWKIKDKQVDFAYAIRYLNTASEYIRKREVEEKACIDSVDADICKDDMWPLRLSEFKMEKNVRTINEYQAKRFAKWLKSNFPQGG